MEALMKAIDDTHLKENKYCKYCFEDLQPTTIKKISVHEKTDGDVDMDQITKECLPELLEEPNEESSKICMECFVAIDDLYKCKMLTLHEIERKKERNLLDLDSLRSEQSTDTEDSSPKMKNA